MDKPTLTFDFAAASTRAASLNPRKVFLAGPEPLSYGELLDRMARLAGFFKHRGLDAGSRVVLATRNDAAAVVLYLALVRNGLTAVLVDPQAPAFEARALLAAAEAQGLFIDADLHEAWAPMATPCTILIRKPAPASLFTRLLGRDPAGSMEPADYPALLRHHQPLAAAPSLPAGLDAHILFTSGTTARPKGVRISQEALVAHLGTLVRHFDYAESSRILNVLPLHHTDGLVQGPLVAFVRGASLHRPMPFSIQALPALLDTIFTGRISHFVTVPAVLALMMRMGEGSEDCCSSPEFRCVVSTAAHLDQALWEAFETRFRTRVANVYGLTETVAGSVFSGPDGPSHRPGTIGKPVDCRVRIVGPDGVDLPDGRTGELLLAGAHLMTGYFQDPAATEAVLRDGWLSTGDLATRDEEGFCRIVGRRKTLIITGGLNLHPEEVSECLNSHPEVHEAVTFGVPDATWGERVVAAVVAGTPAPAEEALVAFLRERLSPFKIPSEIHFLPAFPKGPSGKVILEDVRRLVAGAPAGPGAATSGDLEARVRAAAARVFRVPASSLSADSGQGSTPGWDSLAHLALVVDLEETFDLRLSAADIIRIATLRDAERIVRERTHA